MSRLRPDHRGVTVFGAAFLCLAGILNLAVAGRAEAQTSCPPGGPEVVFYSVTSATEPERTFEAPLREATVVGGDLVQGRVRIFMRFAEPLSSSCTADVYLWRHPSKSVFGPLGESNRDSRVYFQDLFPEGVAEGLQVSGNGDNTAVLVIPTNPYITASPGQHRHEAWFSIGGDGPRHAFAVAQRSSTLELRAAATSTVGNAPVQVTATSSIQLHPRVDIPVMFSVAPRAAGGFLVGSNRPTTVMGILDPGISPSRFSATFVGTPPATPTLVSVLARTMIEHVYAGGRQPEERSVSFTVEPEPARCNVEARVAARAGGLEVVVVNTGSVLCSNLTILTATAGRTTRDIIASVAPGREVRFRQTVAPVVIPPLVPFSRATAARNFGSVSIFLQTKSGPTLIGNRELTREDAVLMNTR